jgi:hypothetical protein
LMQDIFSFVYIADSNHARSKATLQLCSCCCPG